MKFTAPCGHTGEPIIGTFVRCLQGCDSAVKPAARRGHPGHVVDCACKPCQIHRRVTRIIFRSIDGEDVVDVPWDGIDTHPRARLAHDAEIRGFRLLDSDGAIVADGTMHVFVGAGGFTIGIETFMDGTVQMSVVAMPAWETELGELRKADRRRTPNFGLPPSRGTAADIEMALLSVPGVTWALVVQSTVGTVRVSVHGAAETSRDAVRRALDSSLPAGVAVNYNFVEVT